MGVVLTACQGSDPPAPIRGRPGTPNKDGHPAIVRDGQTTKSEATNSEGVESAKGSATPSCDEIVDHELGIYMQADSEALKENLPDRETVMAHCARSTINAEAAACSLAASDVDAIAACSRAALTKETDATAVRSFIITSVPEDADPKPLTADRDYMGFTDTCGVLYREIYPASGVYLVCDGRITAGPMVTPAEINATFLALTGDFTDTQALLASIQANWPAGGTAKLRVHKYGADGSYLGVE